MRFVGLALHVPVPDTKTIWLYREHLKRFRQQKAGGRRAEGDRSSMPPWSKRAAAPNQGRGADRARLRALILRGPDPERDGVSAWTRADIARLIETRFGHRYHVSSLSKILRALGFSRQKTRPVHPSVEPKARMAWLKKGAALDGSGGERASGQADRDLLPG